MVGEVSSKAVKISKELVEKYVNKGYDIISLVPSCTLMMKQEWPLLLTQNEDVKKLSKSTFELSEYIVKLQKEGMLQKPPKKVENLSVTLHHACHSRAQNFGFKAKEMLSLVEGLEIKSIEKCSGHGGTFGFMKDHRETAIKVGKPVIQRASDSIKSSLDGGSSHLVLSECPLASDHIVDGALDKLKITDDFQTVAKKFSAHPIEVLAKAYGIKDFKN